ncbi:AAA family ATPase, partial [bacterium]|nr:AAA family ATPase [bacterium]
MDKLLNLIYSSSLENWSERCKQAFNELFGAAQGRYPEKAQKAVALRSPEFKEDSGVPFAALIHPQNPNSGPYGGMSFVIFPAKDAPCLIAMGVGTQGLSPDEDVLGRPGHARKVQAICSWLNKKYGKGRMVAWAKQDPVRTDIDVPENINESFPLYDSVFQRYGKVLYAIFAPNENRDATIEALKAFLDLNFEERSHYPLAGPKQDSDRIKAEYFEHLLPDLSDQNVASLLADRRFVIIEGPPGTGKTEMALRLLRDQYASNGLSTQFHPNTTYESFVGGLAPIQTKDQLGLRFATTKGFLMQATEQALRNPKQPFLLVIDEINRADLSKILGEAIYLFEANPLTPRELQLSYDFGDPFGNQFSLPKNLHVLGTMNSADRSIAIVDVAVRRRFSFVKLWPQFRVVREHGGKLMQDAFQKLLTIFIEHADETAFSLIPG